MGDAGLGVVRMATPLASKEESARGIWSGYRMGPIRLQLRPPWRYSARPTIWLFVIDPSPRLSTELSRWSPKTNKRRKGLAIPGSRRTNERFQVSHDFTSSNKGEGRGIEGQRKQRGRGTEEWQS